MRPRRTEIMEGVRKYVTVDVENKSTVVVPDPIPVTLNVPLGMGVVLLPFTPAVMASFA